MRLIHERISLVTDCFPVLVLSMEQRKESIMKRKPRDAEEFIFRMKGQKKTLWDAIAGSLIIAAAVAEIPFIASLFGFTSVAYNEYVIAILMALIIIQIAEVRKAVKRRCTFR